jgi:hypothetical protein
MGKFVYMAPEQVLKAKGEVKGYDQRVDIYALGVMMYKLMCGENPFKGENDAETLLMRTWADPKKPRELRPEIPEEAEAIILKAMARDPADRYQSARELCHAIEACLKPGSSVSIKSDDLIMADLIRSLERSEPEASAKMPRLELEEDSEQSGKSGQSGPRLQSRKAPVELEEKGGFLKGLAKTAAVLAVLGGIGYGVYANREPIRHYVDTVRTRVSANSGGDPQPSAPAPSVSARAPVVEGYLAIVESTPPGAAVYEMVEGRRDLLGFTPLQRRMAGGEHTLLVVKKGLVAKRVVVSQGRPTVRLTLGRSSGSAGGGRPLPSAPAGQVDEVPESEMPQNEGEGTQ